MSIPSTKSSIEEKAPGRGGGPRARFRRWLLPGLILLAHAAAALDAARRLSPTWDEIIYPAAGLAQWRTGAIGLNTEHPFLSKLIYALPLLPLRPDLPLSHPSWAAGDAYRFGHQFIFRNRVPAHRLIFWSRVPAAVFSVLTGLLLFLWTRSLWGEAGGLAGLFCYAAAPILLSRAGLALLEMPMYFFLLASLWFYWRWMDRGRVQDLWLCGAAAGLSLLCKLTALPLFPVFLVLELLANPRRGPVPRRFLNFLVICGAASLTVLLAYAPWKGAWAGLSRVAGHLMGFDSTVAPYYFHGHILVKAPSVCSWMAFGVKAPLGLLALGLWGGWLWFRSGDRRPLLVQWAVFGAASLLSALFFACAVSSVHMSPFYLALAALAGGLGRLFSAGGWRAKALVSLLAALSLADTARAHPNHLAYFNALAGGPAQGHRWLGDSDQDWGQSLPALARYLREQGNPRLILAYSGAADPGAYGIRYQDFVSPALVTAAYRQEFIPLDAPRTLLAVGAKVLQSEPWLFGWLRENLRPVAVVDFCFFIYDVSREPEAHRWMARVYGVLRRPREALWAIDRARRLDPGDPEDEKFLQALDQHFSRKENHPR